MFERSLIHLSNFLGQASEPATSPSTQMFSAQQVKEAIATALGEREKTDPSQWHAPWEKWLRFYDYEIALRTCTTFGILIVSWWVLMRIFRKPLEAAQLMRTTVIGSLAAIVYFTLIAAHPLLMVDGSDIIAVTIHKTFAALMTIVALRYVDRLIVIPILTRISGGPPSRFIHQITITVVSIFAIAFYCSYAFGIEVGSLLAGSAVISIVLGLALQETLGNFFSGMVLQASVPFQTGDWIMVGEMEGRVVEMTWRAVTLITPSNNYILIPNSTVAKEKIVNYHTPSVATAINVSVGLDYAIPPNDAKRVLIQAAADTPGVIADPPPGAALASFDDSSIGYKLNFWINEPEKHGAIEQAVRVNIWYRLNQVGFNIPFPIRTIETTDLSKKQDEAKQAAVLSRVMVIAKSPMFSEMSPALQRKLAEATRSYELGAGQVFYRQNDRGDSLFILESGTIQISYQPENGPSVELTQISAPAVFGELSAVTGEPRSATNTAKTDVRVIEVSRGHLQNLFAEDPNLLQHFSELVAKRQQERSEMLKKLGAAQGAQHEHAHAETVLERMKRMFTLIHR